MKKALFAIPIGIVLIAAFIVLRAEHTAAEEREQLQRQIYEEEIKNKQMVQDTKQEIFRLANELRLKHDRLPLVWDDGLAARAQQWADQLAETREFVHSPEDYYSLIFVCTQHEGENLINAFNSDPESIVNSLMRSPAHFQNLLEPWRYTGIGYSVSELKNQYVVQAFCA